MSFLAGQLFQVVQHFVQSQSFAFGKGVERDVAVNSRDELDLLLGMRRGGQRGSGAFLLCLLQEGVYFGIV